jgi:hypothetical protein
MSPASMLKASVLQHTIELYDTRKGQIEIQPFLSNIL